MTRGLALFLLAAAAANAETPPPRAGGSVVLPVEQYRELRARAWPAEPEPDPPPVATTVSRVDWDVTVQGDVATGQMVMVVDVLQEGWAQVPIPSGLLVREARLDGRTVSLVDVADPRKKGGGTAPFALLSRPGRSTLTLDLAVPVLASAGTESVTLPASGAALTRATVVLPRRGVDVLVSGGLVTETAETGATTRVTAQGRPSEPLVVSWRRRLDDRKSVLPLRLRGRVTELVGLGEDGAAVTAEVALEVVQGQASAVTVEIPAGLAINEVSGALVEDWEAAATRLTVRFAQPLEHEATFVVTGEMRGPRDGAVSVPLLRLPEAEREGGGVAVEVLGEGEIKGRELAGLQDADPSDLGGPVKGRESPSLAAFKHHLVAGRAPRQLTVQVQRYTAEAVALANIDEARYRVLFSSEGRALVEASYAVRNTQRAFLAVSLPPGAVLWSALVAGRPVRPGRAPDGTVLLPLEKTRAGGEQAPSAATVLYLAEGQPWAPKGAAQLTLPHVDLQISRAGLEVYAARPFDLQPLPGVFRAAPYELPRAPALSGAATATAAAPAPAPPAQAAQKKDANTDELQGLLQTMQKDGRGTRLAGVLPLAIPFPAVGSPVYLAAELIAAGSAPVVDVEFRRRKEGSR